MTSLLFFSLKRNIGSFKYLLENSGSKFMYHGESQTSPRGSNPNFETHCCSKVDFTKDLKIDLKIIDSMAQCSTWIFYISSNIFINIFHSLEEKYSFWKTIMKSTLVGCHFLNGFHCGSAFVRLFYSHCDQINELNVRFGMF